ncbi:MAG: hypothetical protein ACYS8W_06875 [Planctomycetota bacterium]
MKRNAGFTLIEFITWFGLAAVTFTAVLSFEAFARRTSLETSARILAVQQHERFVRRFERDAARAVKFQVVANKGIVMQVPALGGDGKPVENALDTIVYSPKYEEGGSLIRTLTPGEGSAAIKSSEPYARYLSRVTFAELKEEKYAHSVMQATLEFSVPVHADLKLKRRFFFAASLENCRSGGGR